MIEKPDAYDRVPQSSAPPPPDVMRGVGELISGVVQAILMLVVCLAGLIAFIWLVKTIWLAV